MEKCPVPCRCNNLKVGGGATLSRRMIMFPRPATPLLAPHACGFCILCAAATRSACGEFLGAWLPSEAPSWSTGTFCVDTGSVIPRGCRFAGESAARVRGAYALVIGMAGTSTRGTWLAATDVKRRLSVRRCLASCTCVCVIRGKLPRYWRVLASSLAAPPPESTAGGQRGVALRGETL